MVVHAHKFSFTLLVETFVEIVPGGVLVAQALCFAVVGGAPALFGTLDGRLLGIGPLALDGLDGLVVVGLCLVVVDVCALNVGDFPSPGGEVCAAVESLVVEFVGETGGLFVWEDCMLEALYGDVVLDVVSLGDEGELTGHFFLEEGSYS